jgi:Cu2+-exporting ATPase
MVQLSPTPASSLTNSNENGQNQIASLTLDVGGMKCAGCVAAVERQLGQLGGVIDSCVNLVTAVAVVRYTPGKITPQAIAEHLSQRGFPSQIRHSHGAIPLPTEEKETRENVNWGLTIALVLLLLSGLGHLSHFGAPMIPFFHHPIFHWSLATLAIAIPGREIFLDGWRGLRFGHANMNTLVALGTGSAYLTSCIAWAWPGLGWECFFDEPVMLLGVLLLGRTLESKARQKAKSALTELLALQPSLARLVGRGEDQGQTGIQIPVEQVRVGEWVQVLPGEKIPVDGILVAGKTLVDESLLTGESLPVEKKIDDGVIAGSWNQSGAITVVATHIGAETTLARIIQLVETAQTQKAPMQRLADQVAGWFAYGVMAIALVTLSFWAIAGQSLFPDMVADTGLSPLLLALKLSVSVLVVACPCALGLATPTAILVGTSLGAEQGILIKGGNILEILQRTTVIAFDKTGTLTQGNLQLTDTVPVADITGIELLTLAASVEQGTRHPLAQGLLSSAENLQLLPVENIETEAGQGVQGCYQGDRLLVGNQPWLMEQGVRWELQWQREVDQLLDQGKTVIFVARNQQLQGFLALKDTLRPEAKATIAQLKQWGITPLLLTGDHPAIAKAIAMEVEIEEFQAQMTPQAKVAKIKAMQGSASAPVVTMVGDGINDAPALAQANVGISLSGATAVAMETADVVLMRSQLSDVFKALTLSRATVTKIKQNLLWALGYNLVAVPLAAGAFLPSFAIVLTPAIAAAMMAFSSIVVVVNALSLRYQFPSDQNPE